MEDTGRGRKDTETACKTMIKEGVCFLQRRGSLFVPSSNDTIYSLLIRERIVLQCVDSQWDRQCE